MDEPPAPWAVPHRWHMLLVRSALSVGPVTGLARRQGQPVPGPAQYPPSLPGNPSQGCQVDCASSMDMEVADLPGHRGSNLAGPCPTHVWRAGHWSHPAEFPQAWSSFGRQHGTCGRGWMAPRAGAWNSGPRGLERGLACQTFSRGSAASTWQGQLGRCATCGAGLGAHVCSGAGGEKHCVVCVPACGEVQEAAGQATVTTMLIRALCPLQTAANECVCGGLRGGVQGAVMGSSGGGRFPSPGPLSPTLQGPRLPPAPPSHPPALLPQRPPSSGSRASPAVQHAGVWMRCWRFGVCGYGRFHNSLWVNPHVCACLCLGLILCVCAHAPPSEL